MQDLIAKQLHIFACPACGGPLAVTNETLACTPCRQIFPSDNGIPLLFHPHDPKDRARDLTDIVKDFYEARARRLLEATARPRAWRRSLAAPSR